MSAEYYEQQAKYAESQGATALAAQYRELAADLSKPAEPVPDPVVDVPPTSGPPAIRPALPAYQAQVVQPEDRRPAGDIGKSRNLRELVDKQPDIEKETIERLSEYYILRERMPVDEAIERAKSDLRDRMDDLRYNVQGEREYGDIDSFWPTFRESRIRTYLVNDPETNSKKQVQLYLDTSKEEPELREPTPREHAWESLAKQTVLDERIVADIMGANWQAAQKAL